jgi:hypothetical protein
MARNNRAARPKNRTSRFLFLAAAVLLLVQFYPLFPNLVQTIFPSNQSSPKILTLSVQNATQPYASSIAISVPMGGSQTVGIIVNNSLSGISWVIERLTLSYPSNFSSLSIQPSNLIPYASTVPNYTVSSPFSITARALKTAALSVYTVEGQLEMRSSLLPPFVSISLPFNITIIVVPSPPPSPTVQEFFIDSIIILVDTAVMVVLVDVFLRRIT